MFHALLEVSINYSHSLLSSTLLSLWAPQLTSLKRDNFNTLTNCLGLNSTGKQEPKTAQVPPFWCYSVEQCGAVQCVVEMCSAAAAATAGTATLATGGLLNVIVNMQLNMPWTIII